MKTLRELDFALYLESSVKRARGSNFAASMMHVFGVSKGGLFTVIVIAERYMDEALERHVKPFPVIPDRSC